jgi:hypothetical protein
MRLPEEGDAASGFFLFIIHISSYHNCFWVLSSFVSKAVSNTVSIGYPNLKWVFNRISIASNRVSI